jgi:transitional endoplasmic reticulum ATPase
MILHRNPTIFFTPFCLLGAAIEYSAMSGDHYEPTWMLPYTLAATCMLAIAVAAMLVVQVVRHEFNVTPFLPALVLVAASVVMMMALAKPGVLAAEHWDSPLVATLYRAILFGFLPLALLSLLAATRAAVYRLPLSRHSFGTGRMYRVEPAAAVMFGVQVKEKAVAPVGQQPASVQAPQPQPYPALPAKITFADLYGNQDLKDSLIEAGREWREKGKNGVLLFGEPGTGKTAFGEALAGEMGIPFIYVTFGDMASKWVNETTERLVAIFNAANAQQPCMLFIDEIDAVLKDRRSLSAGSSEEYERIVATFLGRATALQGSRVLLVAATNYIDRLDDAAIREGRFDFKVQVPLPDGPARRHLVEARMAANACTTDDETLDRLTRRWGGFNVPRIIACTNTACELGRADAGHPALRPGQFNRSASDAAPPAVVLDYPHFYRALRKIQGRKGGAPEGAKSLDDLFLDDEPAARLREISSQLSRVDDIERMGGSIPKGILFYGPPGTGKTATAMALARACGWSFIERNGRDLMREGEIDKLRGEASDLRPAIVFLDEADDILADRTYSNFKSVTNELLTLMDGAGGMLQDVVWIAATNHPEGIDSAALRGGRFEQKVAFGPPGDQTLLRMVMAWASEHAADLAEDPASWAAKSFEHVRGQTPANVQSILRLANNLAVTKHLANGASRAVTVGHVAAAAGEVGA